MTGYRIIYACPDCDGDLEEDGSGLWCPHCQRTAPYACFFLDDDGDDDDQH